MQPYRITQHFRVIGRENKPYQSFLADLFNLPDYDPKTYGQEPGSSHLHTHNPALSPGCLFILRASPLSTLDAMDRNWLLGDAEVEQLSMNLMRMSRYETRQRLDLAYD